MTKELSSNEEQFRYAHPYIFGSIIGTVTFVLIELITRFIIQ